MKLTKGMKKGERRPLFVDGYLEYDNKGLLYYTAATPAFLCEPESSPGEAFIVDGIHHTYESFINRVMEGETVEYP